MDWRQLRRIGKGVWWAAALLAAAAGCNSSGEHRPLNVAYSGIGDPNTWFLSFSDQLAAEAGRRHHAFFRRIARFDTDDQKHQESQIQDVSALIDLDPDVLVLGPVAVNRAMQAVRIANDAMVPVIIVNRDAEDPVPSASERYFATVHSDFKNFGKEVCGKQLRRIFGDTADIRILQLRGTEGGSNTIGMDAGCREGTRADGHMRIICEYNGNYDLEQSYQAAKKAIADGCDFNAVFGHGDTEGVGAVMALQEAAVLNPKYRPGIDPSKGHIIVTSCDASKMALQAVKAGTLYGVMTTSPYYASQVFDAIEAYFARRPVPAFIPVTDFFIDVNNINQYEAFGF
jgi:ABC-type sugar transport system substrate-binding protein